MHQDLRSQWKDQRPTLGAWLAVPSPVTAEAIARMGFDWVTIDMQHGLIGYGDCRTMLQATAATGVVALVRVPSQDPAMIGRVLDAGAQGVIVPLIDGADEAAAAVAACRYPPSGCRSFGPTRAALAQGPDYFSRANESLLCIPMIETARALDELDAILTVPGVDAVYVGPNDLSLALGLDPAQDHAAAPFVDALERIVESCRRHGVVPGIHTSASLAAKRIEQGFLFLPVSSDLGAMLQQARRDLGSVRGAGGGATA